MWFSDESLKKSKKFYNEQIDNNTDDMVELYIFYGREPFKIFFERTDIWDEIVRYLKKHKQERSKEILNVPDFDTSSEIKTALLQIKHNNLTLIKNLLSSRTD